MKNTILEIGKTIPRADAYAKVTGKERYAADFHCPGMLWAGVKRAGVAHARIKAVHAEAAGRVPGVLSVLTSKDVKGTNRQGVVRKDQPVLADDRIRFPGDPVALVIADDRDSLAAALERIEMDLEPLPPVFDPEEAMERETVLIHEDHPGGNVLLKGAIEKGEGEAGLKECDYVVEAEFRLPYQEHAYLETEGGWAVFKEGSLEITVSTQTPFRDRAEVAEALGLGLDKVRIIAPFCGGAFGGKDGITVQSLLGLAALHHPDRAVKIVWHREESFLASAKRHPARLHYTLGAGKDGCFHALRAKILYDTGPYDHLGGVVMALGLEHAAGPYRIPHCSLKAWAVYTNNPLSGAFRGFGVPQVNAAMEQIVDMMAEKIGISPLEIRLRNALKRGDKNGVGATLTTSTGITACLETLRDHPMWKNRQEWKEAAGAFRTRGVGIACVMQGMGYGPVVPDTANAKIEITEEGKFRVYCGVVDMGQGNDATCLQIAGDILGQDSLHMELVLPDTSETLPSGSASASRTTYTFGNALIVAAGSMKRRVLEKAADLLMAAGHEEMALVPGLIRHLPSGKEIPLGMLARLLGTAERVVTSRFRAPVSRESVTSDPDLRLHGIPHLIFSYGVHMACVEVDRLTGAVEVKRYLAVTDSGRVINPQILEQQIQGGIAQGLGYALMEEFRADKGRCETPDFSTYIVPTSLDLPDMETIAVELYEQSGPFGLKGAGEIGIDGPVPAVANAVANGCGVRITNLPLKAERVYDLIRKRKMQQPATKTQRHKDG
ncbi:MAG: carbon monoxide dehydrogenase [Deltaproteobacteria bacterium HGW-Deltaproteobacteria-15]|jgi:CO/xanthine dehydrogenase Mo-binding subunit|nr:MAG: carbon monoxide dehydrogenase [Deltaproteobacteria bacterium HGW-Deltaproteobacteria-15]